MPSIYQTALAIGAAIVLAALPLETATAQQGAPHALTRIAASDTIGAPRPLAHASNANITILQDRRQLAAKLLSDDAIEMNGQLSDLNDELAVLRHGIGQALSELGQSYADLIEATGRLANATDGLQVSAVRANEAGFDDSQHAVDHAQADVDVAQAGLDRARDKLAQMQRHIAALEQTVGDFEALYAAERSRVETQVIELTEGQVLALNRALDTMAQANVVVDIDSDDIQAILDAKVPPQRMEMLVSSFAQEARLAAVDKGPMSTSEYYLH